MTWLMPFAPVGGRPVLVCLPQAGAGCGAFRAWQDVLGDEVSVVGVQLPGRENRFAAPPPESFAHVVAEIVAALVDTVSTPMVLFGHSLGGLIGYEVARALPQPPDALVLAASLPPHRSGRATGSIADDTDEGFLKALAAKGLDEEMRELALAVLQQDRDLAATYEDPAGAPVPCDLHVWGGERDERVSPEDLEEWRAYATRSFHMRQFAGGHDFCLESLEVPLAVRALLAARQEV
jgi:surfactin synthase thioesterase subunit